MYFIKLKHAKLDVVLWLPDQRVEMKNGRWEERGVRVFIPTAPSL